MLYQFILLPIIAAFIGWFTNWVAIKMLFHPKNPIKILGITVQGIFPKRQAQFAQKLGEIVSKELLSFEEIAAKIANPKNVEKIIPEIENYLEHFLRQKLSQEMPVISMFISDKLINQFKTLIAKELVIILPDLLKKYMHNLQSELDLEQIITAKVANFSSDKLEQIVQSIMSKELKFVEIVGAILGFLVGIIQVLITQVL